MHKIVECVINFSEGRDLAVVDSIVAAVKSTKVLNVHSDPDHNRTVVTFMGEPKKATQAAFELTERAMQLLDIKEHQGEHPFIGVVDVIPFVPIKNITVEETVKLARDFGKNLTKTLALPVYFYGEINKKELPSVRKGNFDKGKHVTAGAVAVGVRDFLIAFNVNLNTSDIDIARSIAKNIREKSGGLAGIRALGIQLKSRNITQVSINITNHKMTSMKKVFDQVKMWAKEYKVEIIESELVGMIPKEAYFEGMTEYLKLPGFSEGLILR